MRTAAACVPKPVHDAILKWRQTYLPDYDLLLEHWDRFFPKDRPFQLCAYRELGMCDTVECGARKGQPKAVKAGDMEPEQAQHLLGAIRAQASTEFGSIQQHQLTLARAQSEEDQFWVLRVMAEELRHGYQMIHLLLSDDWSCASDDSGPEMVEEILSMRTGSHILGAFNVDFDSFVDNVVFCALIDRVGKFQLSMQKVSAYKPMAESMPQMLREEAFHLATGVVPLRRWAQEAARGSVYITMGHIQKALNKWYPRGLEMFGDERGGGTNVRYGLKPMKNAEAQEEYIQEVGKVLTDLNSRFVRERLPRLSVAEVDDLIERILSERTRIAGISWEDLLRLPDQRFFRRRGVPAFSLVGFDGEEHPDVESYERHLAEHLPDAYRAGRDFQFYLETLRKHVEGELSIREAVRQMPKLGRVGGVCPCSKSVRWIHDPAHDGNGGARADSGDPAAAAAP